MIDRALFDAEFFRILGEVSLPRRLRSGSDTGLHETKRLGESLEFAELRPYQAGDDLRQVDWNAYRRFRRLLVRRYQAERSHDVYILIDTSTSMGLPALRFNRARQIAGAVAVLAARRQDRVTLMGFSEMMNDLFVQSRRDRGALKVLRHLSLLKSGGGTDLEGCLATATEQMRRNSMLFLISDFLAPSEMETALKVLERLAIQLLFVRITTREERTPLLRGDVVLEDAETGRLHETSGHSRTLSTYARRFREHTDALALLVGAHGGRFIDIDAESSLLHSLQTVLYPS